MKAKDNNGPVRFYERWLVILAAVLFIVAWCLTCSSCGSTKEARVDSVYVYGLDVRYDTIVKVKKEKVVERVKDSVIVEKKGDTIKIDRWRTEYVDRMVVDSSASRIVDSLRAVIKQKIQEVKVEEVKKGTWKDMVGAIALLAVIIGLLVWSSRKGNSN